MTKSEIYNKYPQVPKFPKDWEILSLDADEYEDSLYFTVKAYTRREYLGTEQCSLFYASFYAEDPYYYGKWGVDPEAGITLNGDELSKLYGQFFKHLGDNDGKRRSKS